VAEIEQRVNDCENCIKDHERRITGTETDIKSIKQECSNEKINFAELKAKIETSLANHDSTMSLLKWVVIIALTVIAALAGVKVALPGI
jgi:hypothetical protein